MENKNLGKNYKMLNNLDSMLKYIIYLKIYIYIVYFENLFFLNMFPSVNFLK